MPEAMSGVPMGSPGLRRMGFRTAVAILTAAALVLICMALAGDGHSNRTPSSNPFADELLQRLISSDSLTEEYSKLHKQFEKDHQARVCSSVSTDS